MENAKLKQDRPLRRTDILFHGIKTSRLIGALLLDRRISMLRKIGFIGSIILLIIILIFPDLLNEAFLSIVLPIIGTIVGAPLDAGFDWVAFSLLLVNLLQFFPTDVVAEHTSNIFS